MLSFIILEAFNKQQFADHFDRNKSLYYGALGLLAGGLGTKYWLNYYNNNKIPSPKTEPIIDKSVPKTQETPTKTENTDFALPPEEPPSNMPPGKDPKIPTVINRGLQEMDKTSNQGSSIPGAPVQDTVNMG